jgi:putative membrane protein
MHAPNASHGLLPALTHLVSTGVSVYLVAKIMPGMKARSLGSALWFACVVAVVNAAFWYALGPIGRPFHALTLGVGSAMLNGVVFSAASRIAHGVRVSGCITGAIASIAVTFLNGVLARLIARH